MNMANYYYNTTTKGFYIEGVNTPPANSTVITKEQYDWAFSELNSGKELYVEADVLKSRPRTVVAPSWDYIRSKRDDFLSFCDWTQMPDSPLTPEKKAAWATYRQALRDIPKNFANTADIVWPTQPA
jgi:hypothetical protein